MRCSDLSSCALSDLHGLISVESRETELGIFCVLVANGEFVCEIG